MSEEDENEQTIRVKVAKNATEEEKKSAIGAAYFEKMKSMLVEEYEKRGIPLEDPDHMTVEEANNLSQALTQLRREERGFKVKSQAPDGGETTSWQANEQGYEKRNFTNQREYGSQEDLIRDLRQQARSNDVVKKAEAEAILTELYKKWGRQLKKDFEDGTRKSIVNYEPEKGSEEEKKKIKQLQREGA
jgi:hypothetical protein